jgi:hypothetical protein
LTQLGQSSAGSKPDAQAATAACDTPERAATKETLCAPEIEVENINVQVTPGDLLELQKHTGHEALVCKEDLEKASGNEFPVRLVKKPRTVPAIVEQNNAASALEQEPAETPKDATLEQPAEDIKDGAWEEEAVDENDAAYKPDELIKRGAAVDVYDTITKTAPHGQKVIFKEKIGETVDLKVDFKGPLRPERVHTCLEACLEAQEDWMRSFHDEIDILQGNLFPLRFAKFVKALRSLVVMAENDHIGRSGAIEFRFSPSVSLRDFPNLQGAVLQLVDMVREIFIKPLKSAVQAIDAAITDLLDGFGIFVRHQARLLLFGDEASPELTEHTVKKRKRNSQALKMEETLGVLYDLLNKLGVEENECPFYQHVARCRSQLVYLTDVEDIGENKGKENELLEALVRCQELAEVLSEFHNEFVKATMQLEVEAAYGQKNRQCQSGQWAQCDKCDKWRRTFFKVREEFFCQDVGKRCDMAEDVAAEDEETINIDD